MSSGFGKQDDDVDLFVGDKKKVKVDEKPKEEIQAKCVFVGDGAVGKTCTISTRYYGRFPNEYVPLGWDNYSLDVVIDDRTVKMSLWDTAGQEDYDRLRPLSYPDTSVFVVCFSLVEPNSFLNVTEKWIPEITYHCPGVPFILVGTKLDLREDVTVLDKLRNRDLKPITTEDGEKLMKTIHAVSYIEYSSLTLKNLNKVFEDSATTALLYLNKGTTSKEGSSSVSGIIKGLKNLVGLGNQEKQSQKKKDLEKFRKRFEDSRRMEREERERARREKIENCRRKIEKDLEQAKKDFKPLFEHLSHDIIQFILNRWVILDLEKDCYPLRSGMSGYKNQLNLSLKNFISKHHFGYFPSYSSSIKSRRKKKNSSMHHCKN